MSAVEPARTFANGVHPLENKRATASLSIQRMPFCRRYVLPLDQHIGRPAEPVVSASEPVARGQLVARPAGFVSTALHSPVDGRVVAVAERQRADGRFSRAIEIEIDPYATQQAAPQTPVDPGALSSEDFVKAVQAAGLVGLGGAAFPSHVKYALPEGRRCSHLVVNGCECEPYLTCDHRLMVERPDAVVRGTEIARRALGAREATIGVELNKADAIDALRSAIAADLPIRVAPLAVKYPQGAEQMLIKAITSVVVPAGKLPLDVEMVVNNVGTMAALADVVDEGRPLYERVVTVSGPGVRRPANLMVPIGTPIRDVLRFCGGLSGDTRQVVMGGPMMGSPVSWLDGPVLKGTSGLLAFTAHETGRPDEYPCIRCARCLEACARFLNASLLARLARAGRLEALEEAYVMDCMECGACSFACPSGIPIVQLIRAGKAAVRKARR